MKNLTCALFLMAIAPVLVAQTIATSGSLNVNGSTTIGPVSIKYIQPNANVDTALLDRLMTSLPEPILIRPQDRLAVSVFGVPDYSTDGRIEDDGTLQLPYIGPLELAGLTITQAESKIANALVSKSLVLDPAVKIVASEQPSTVITVSGEVARPGIFPAFGKQTLADVLAKAGGLLNTASPYLTLVRKGIADPIIIPLGNDPSKPSYSKLPVFDGDQINVSKVGVYYIVGAIRTQGAYPLKNATPTTVGQALAGAGGFGFEALLDSTMIARTEGDHRVLLHVHAGKILRGKARDVALENDDIVFVPTSSLKAAVKGGATGLIVSLASTYIYAHP